MTRKWPSFVTHDIPDTDEGAEEMMRRWNNYDQAMKKIIDAGGVHQDKDGWWVLDATGELIGPDPEIERPRTAEEVNQALPLKYVLPGVHESIIRGRGRPKVEKPKEAVTLRLDPDVVAFFQEGGADWRTRMADLVTQAVENSEIVVNAKTEPKEETRRRKARI